MQPSPAPQSDPDKPAAPPAIDEPNDREPLSPIIYTAGALSLALLIGAALKYVTLNESLSHLLTSIVVVAIIHLLDHYIFKNATWRELGAVSFHIENNITAKMQSSLSKLTREVSQTVTDKSEKTDRETKIAFDRLVEQTQNQAQELSNTIIGNVSQSTRQALEALQAEVNSSVGKRSDKLLADTNLH